MDDPIGGLIIKVSQQAKKKSSKTHTETSGCGCLVEVSWFSEGGSTVHTERCSDHPVR